nr:hypothetical protein [Tanacetum cinerariifolium]
FPRTCSVRPRTVSGRRPEIVFDPEQRRIRSRRRHPVRNRLSL